MFSVSLNKWLLGMIKPQRILPSGNLTSDVVFIKAFIYLIKPKSCLYYARDHFIYKTA